MRAETLPPGLAASFDRPAPVPVPGADWAFDALGTAWVLTTDTPVSAATRSAVTTELDRLDRFWSRFRPDSTVSEMARHPGRYPIASDDQPLVDWYRALYDASGGAVTPLVGQTLADAGYDATYSLRPRDTVAATPAWEGTLAGHTGELHLRRPALLDVGAAGKGFAVDRVAGILAREHDEFVVDGSGDLRVSARADAVRIALEHPLDARKAIGVVALTSGAICASAANRRAWADWHHIVDPRTGSPTRDVLATWVIAPTALHADGLATALFFTPAGDLQRSLGDIGFDYVIMHRDGTVEHSPIPGLELFT